MSYIDFRLFTINQNPTSLYIWGDNTYGQLGDNKTPNYFSWTKISSGELHSLALRNDGTLWAWGFNAYGQLGDGTSIHRSSPVQLGTSSWSVVSAGGMHSVAIRSDGSLWTWGRNHYGQHGLNNLTSRNSPAQIGSSSWSVVSAGRNYTGAIDILGRMFLWGMGNSGQLGLNDIAHRSSPVQLGTSSWSIINAGETHTVALDTTNKLFSWGDNTYGELGDGTTSNRSSPVQIGSSSWTKVSAGGTHTAAITSDSTLYTWGLDNYGQLGLNTTFTGNYWTSISQGRNHTVAVRNDNTLWSWGRNNAGQLGLNDTVTRSSPVQIGSSNSWTQVAVGDQHSVARTVDGKLFVWGDNTYGQLGYYGNVVSTAFSKISVCNSGSHTVALRNDGSIWTWGLNNYGQLGVGDVTNRNSPVQVTGASSKAPAVNLLDNSPTNDWIDIIAGRNHTVAINTQNQLFTWGRNDTASLGDNTTTNRSVPTLIGLGYDYKKILASDQATWVQTVDNNIYVFGYNNSGQLGLNDTEDRSLPVFFDTSSNWKTIATASDAVLGLKNDDTLWAWGLNNNGQLGLNDTISRSIPSLISTNTWKNLSIGTNHTLAIADDDTLWGWGLNNTGQLGLDDTISRSSPIQLSADTIWSSVLASNASYALDKTGTLWSWGLNSDGQLGDETTISRSSPIQVSTESWVNICAGTDYILGTLYDSSLYAWGNNTNGQLGVEDNADYSSPVLLGTQLLGVSSPVQVGTSSWSQISAGKSHSLGIGIDGILYGWGLNAQGQIGGATSIAGYQWTKVVSGPNYKLGIRADGKLFAWGNNSAGQLGDNTVVSKIIPTIIGRKDTWKDIAVGQGSLYFSMAIRSDGKLYAWGNNTVGQLGILSWKQVSAGAGHTLLIRSDGTLFSTGLNDVGQLGLNDIVNRSTLTTVSTSSWSIVSAGVSLSAAIDANGRLFTWGFNANGALGIASTTNRSSPTLVTTGSWAQVSATDYVVAITKQRSLWTWGNNNNGQLGIGTTASSKIPRLLDGTTSGYSVGFDGFALGGGDHLRFPMTSNFVLSGNFTIECWVYLNTFASENHILVLGTPGVATVFGFKVDTVGRVSFLINTALTWSWPVSYISTVRLTIGDWHHIAFVRNGTGNFTIYVDGIPKYNTKTFTNPAGVSGNVYIGSNYAQGSGHVKGYVSNLRIVKDQALYNSTFTPSTAPLTTTSQGAIASNVILLTCQNSTNIDNGTGNSGVGFTFTAVGTPTPTVFNPFSNISSTDSTSWISVATGSGVLAIKNDGTLYAWGNNNFGQLGDSTTISKSSPVQISSSSWSLVATSRTGHSFGIIDYMLYAWGNNFSGELGLNNGFVNVSSPTQVSTTLSFINVTAGTNTTLAMSVLNNLNILFGWGSNNSNFLNNIVPFKWTGINNSSGLQTTMDNFYSPLYTWGDNTYGQVGDNTTIARSSPVQLGGFLGAKNNKVVVNTALNSLLVGTDGSLYIWGDNTYGQIGDGTTISKSSPVQIGATGNWNTAVISSSGHVLAISVNGLLYAWGNNTYNELGQQDSAVYNRSSPVVITNDADWISVSVGNNYSTAIKNNRGIYTWGRNDFGQLGRSNLLAYTTIGLGLASRNDGKIFSWGRNDYGQIGNNSPETINRSSPVQVTSLSNATVSWIQISSGIGNTKAGIKITGTLYTWGDNTYGQLGISDTIPRSQPVQIGISSWTQVYANGDNVYAIKSDNTLWAWGRNDIGQLGTNDAITYSSPVQVGLDTNWKTVVANSSGHVLALKTNGLLYAWGNNTYNQLGQNEFFPTTRSSPVQIGTSSWSVISAGYNNSLAIRADGALFGWGRNDHGQLTQSTALSWSRIANSNNYSLAIRSDGRLFSWGRNNYGQLGVGNTINRSFPVQIPTSYSVSNYSASFFPSGYVTISAQTALTFPSDFTIEYWIRPIFYNGSYAGVIDARSGIVSQNWFSGLRAISGTYRVVFYLNSSVIYTGNRPIPIAVWTHIAVVRFDGTLSFYVNGVLDTFWTGITSTLAASGTTQRLGSMYDAATSTYGYISNLRVVKGQALYNSTFAPSTAPLTTTSQDAIVSNVSLLTFQDSTFKDNSSNNFTFTPIGSPALTLAETPFNAYYSWTQVSSSLYHAVALRNDGTIWAWGRNDQGQLGQNDTITRSIPVQIGSSSWTNIYAGMNSIFAKDVTGTLFAQGDNSYGQLGYGDTISRSSMVQIGTSSWITISASSTGHVLGITGTSALFAWGNNSYSELGLVSDISSSSIPWTLHRSRPTQIGTSSWTSVSTGVNFSSAIRIDGGLFTWGINNNGQTAVAPVTYSWTQVTAQGLLGNNNKVFTFGNNSNSTLGIYTSVSRSAPTQISSYFVDYYSTNFTAATDFVAVPYNAALYDWWTTDYFIEYWIYPRSFVSISTGESVVLGNVDRAGLTDYWSFGPIAGGIVKFYWYSGAANIFGTGTIPLNQWSHLSFTFKSNIMKIWINGNNMDSKVLANTPQSSASFPLSIGRFNNISFDGYITNLRIVRGSLPYAVEPLDIIPTSESTVSSYPNNTVLLLNGNVQTTTQLGDTIVDASTNALTFTIGGTPTVSPLSPFGIAANNANSVYFNGSSWLISSAMGSALGTQTFTIEVWVYPISTSGIIIDNRPGSTNGVYFAINWSPSNMQLMVNNANRITASGSGVAVNTWSHVAYVKNGTTGTFYLNGVNIGSGTDNYNYLETQWKVAYAAFGVGRPTAYFSNLRVVLGTALYTSNFTPSTTPLTAISGTALLLSTPTLQNNTFADSSSNNLAITRSGTTTQGTFTPFIGNGYYSTYFNGSSYLRVPYSALFDLSGGDWTMETWFNVPSFAAGMNIVSKDTYGSNFDWNIVIINSTTLRIYTAQATASLSATVPTMSINTWYHVAIVRNGTTTSIYLNGISYASSNFGLTNASQSYVTLGCSSWNNPGGFVTGYISNLRIVKGTAVYTADFTPSTTPLTNIINTSLLTFQSNRFIDNSTNNLTISVLAGTPSVQTIVPFDITSTYSPTINGGSGYFNGTTDYLTAPNNANFAPGTGAFTIECWFYPTAALTNAGILDTRSAVSSTSGILFRQGDNATNGLVIYAFAGPISNPAIMTGLVLNQWNHVALVRNSSNSMTVYINGVGGTAVSNSVNLTDTKMTIATFGEIPVGSTKISGYLSNLRFVKDAAVYTANFTPSTTPVTAITNTSLLLNFTNAGIINNSSPSTALTVFGDTTISTSVVKFSTGSIYFDGTGDWIHLPAGPDLEFGGDNFTIDFWFYTSSTSRQWFIHAATDWWFGIDYNSVGTNKLGLWASSNGTSWNLINADSGGNGIGTNTLTLNQWNFIVAQRSGDFWSLFLNNNQEVNVNVAGSIVSRVTQQKVIGSSAIASHLYPVNGYIDSFRIIKGIGLYNTSRFIVPTSPLQPITNTQLLILQNDTIVDNSINNVTPTYNIIDVSTSSTPFAISSVASKAVFNQISSYGANTHFLATRPDGLLYAWGLNSTGQLGDGTTINKLSPTLISTSSWSIVSSGNTNSIAIKNDGTLWVWGDNTYGQLGDGTTVNKSSPIQIGTSSWTKVSAGFGHILGITIDGSLYGWGQNTIGQLGLSDTINRSSPVQIATGSSFIAISAGVSFSLFVRSNYTLYGTGFNTSGQVGDNSIINRSSPVQIGATVGTSSWTQVSTAFNAGFAIQNGGQLYSWGNNNNGILGGSSSVAIASTINRSAPVQIGPAGSSWTQVVGNQPFGSVIALTTAYTVFTWGYNNDGQLGLGDTISRSAPTQITTPAFTSLLPDTIKSPVQIGTSSWSQVNASRYWLGAIDSTGRLFTWGHNSVGQLGLNDTISRSSPVQIGTSSWTQLVAGTNSAVAYRAIDGLLFSWGENATGQIGDYTTVNKSSPVAVNTSPLTYINYDIVKSPTQIGTSSWSQVSAGDLHTLAIKLDSTLYSWGHNSVGQLGLNDIANRSSPVQIGTSSWTVLGANGFGVSEAVMQYQLYSWGRNDSGQLGDNTTVNKSSPVAVAVNVLNLMTDINKDIARVGTSSWIQISAGNSHVLALRSDRSLFAWGSGLNGEVGDNTALHRSSPVQISVGTSFTVISAGNSASAAITTAGGLFTWGAGFNGIQGSGATTNRNLPTQVGASNWSQVNVGVNSMIGATISNAAFVWGLNTSGQLGLNDTISRSSPVQLGSNLAGSMYQTVFASPVVVSTFTTASWVQISAGEDHISALDNSARVYAWGQNDFGQFGDTTRVDTLPTKSSPTQVATAIGNYIFINTSSPVQVATGTSWNAIAAGGTHVVAIKSDNTLWGWGINTFGQAGTFSTLTEYVPKQLEIYNTWSSVAAGADFTAAINSNKTLWRWGFNSSSDLNFPHRSNPLQLGIDTYNQVSIANNTAFTLNTQGKLYGWGKITTDDGFYFNQIQDIIPWASASSFVAVNAGDSFVHGILSDNTAWAYGNNSVGQLGDGTTLTRSSPVQIGTIFKWSLLGGGVGGPALQAGALFVTGLNTSGQLGLNDGTNRSNLTMVSAQNQGMYINPVRIGANAWSSVVAGGLHSLAIQTNNTLWAWGYNSDYQLGLGDATYRSSPVQIGTSSWIQVSAGLTSSAAIRLDNTLWTWGLNTRGQLGDNTISTRASPVQIGLGYWNSVVVGASHMVALSDNNSMYIWGDDNYGQ